MFTIHIFSCSSTRPRIGFEDGQRLVRQVSTAERWHNPSFTAVRLEKSVSYILVATPPVPANTSPAPVIKEWGSSVDAEECFTLAELEEFRSTDFKSQSEPHLFLLPMDKIIPPPYLRLPSADRDTAGNHSHFVPPFRPYQGELLPIAPHTQADILSSSPYTHRVWIIPIRGVPGNPFEHATAAIVLDPMSVRSPTSAGDRPISWTPAALKSFWSFLGDLVDDDVYGSVSSSLQIAYFRPSEPRSGLQWTDHFRVYHEASMSMYLRNIFDLWEFEQPSNVGAPSKPIRLLRGARLILLTSVSKGLCVLELVSTCIRLTASCSTCGTLYSPMYFPESRCTLLSQLYPLQFDKLASISLVRIYHAGFDRKCGWKYTGLRGRLLFGKQKYVGATDVDSNVFSFHLFDVDGKLLWKCSVPATIQYHRDPPFFHIFRGLSRMWGFVIEHDDESTEFYEEVVRRTRGEIVARRPIKRHLSPRS